MVNLLVFAAHPDDEGAMFGTITKYARLSKKVVIVWATKGERWIMPIREFKPFLYYRKVKEAFQDKMEP